MSGVQLKLDVAGSGTETSRCLTDVSIMMKCSGILKKFATEIGCGQIHNADGYPIGLVNYRDAVTSAFYDRISANDPEQPPNVYYRNKIRRDSIRKPNPSAQKPTRKPTRVVAMTDLPDNGDPAAADGSGVARRQVEPEILPRQQGTPRRPPPNYLSRKEQYRLFVLCTSLMLVLVMMNEARKPTNWKWLWAGESPETQSSEPIDTRLDITKRKLSPDAFQALARPELARPELARPELARPESTAADSGTLESAKLPPGITSEMLEAIEDNTVLRVAENDAWYAMLGILKDTDSSELESYSSGNVGFAQLFQQSNIYRGKVVRTQGTAHRVEAITPRSNPAGIEQLFRWIIEPAGPSNAPIVVYTLEKPDGFEVGDDLREEVTFTGFFFKRWAYAAGDGTRIAPLLLARNADWKRREPVARVEPPSGSTILMLLLGLSVVAGAIAAVVYRSTLIRRPEIERIRAAEGDVVRFDEDEVLPSVGESLNQIASRTDAGDSP